MKAILIDVHQETVRQVEVDDKRVLKDWYKHINCGMVEVAHNFYDKMDSIMVDEEGLFTMNENSKFFSVTGGHQPFIGNGLVVGLNPMNGESVDHHITVEDLRSRISFHNVYDIQMMI